MNKQAVLDALKTVKTASGQSNIVDAGHVRNLQIFGDEVVVDVVADRAALHLKKKLEVDILTAIHTHVHPKAKIKVNLTVEAPAETEAQRIRGEASEQDTPCTGRRQQPSGAVPRSSGANDR